MAETGNLVSNSDLARTERAVLDYERRRGGSPTKPSRRDPRPRPPIFACLLGDLETGGTAEAAVLDRVRINEVQHVRLRGVPTGGTFKLSFDPPGEAAEETTAAIAFDATAADFKAALVDLEAFDVGDLKIVRLPGDWIVEFRGQYAGTEMPLLTVADDSIEGFAEVVAIRGIPWTYTGRSTAGIETVECVIPVGTPTPLTAGTIVAANFYHGAGYCVTAAECRQFDGSAIETPNSTEPGGSDDLGEEGSGSGSGGSGSGGGSGLDDDELEAPPPP